jgi:hypothetical protein
MAAASDEDEDVVEDEPLPDAVKPLGTIDESSKAPPIKWDPEEDEEE